MVSSFVFILVREDEDSVYDEVDLINFADSATNSQ